VTTWRDRGTETVAALLDAKQLTGFRRTATASPGEAVVVIRNGRVSGLQTEGQIRAVSAVDRFRSVIGLGPDVRVLMVDTTPFSLSYWLEDPNVPRDRTDGESLGLPVLTSDGQMVSAQINIELAVVPDESELLLQAMRGRASIGTYEVGRLLKDQLVAMAVGVQISTHKADELRGNSDLLRGIYEETKTQLESRLNGYGLRLIGLSINWGLTQRESEQIAERRRESELADELHRRTLEGDRSHKPEQVSMNVSGGVPMWVVIAILLVAAIAIIGSLIILSQSNSPAEQPISSGSSSELDTVTSSPTSEPSVTDTAQIIFGFRGLTADFSESSSPVRRISFAASEGNLTSASVQVMKDERELTVPALAGTAGIHSYLNIEIASDKSPHDVGADIRFEIAEDWLEANEVFKEQVALYRWDGEFWTQLDTQVITSEFGAVDFTSQTPGFSFFAIAIRTLTQAGLDSSGNSTVEEITITEPETEEQKNLYVSSETGLSFVVPEEWILEEISDYSLFIDSADGTSYVNIDVTTDLAAFPSHQLWTAYQVMIEYSQIDQTTYEGIDSQSFVRNDGGFEYQYIDSFSFEGDPTAYISGQNYIFLDGLAVSIYFISSSQTIDANLTAFQALLDSLVLPNIQGSGFDDVPQRECETLDDEYLYNGIVKNTTFDIEVFATFTFLQIDCDIVGNLEFDSDELTGSGILLGRIDGADIVFVVSDLSNDSSTDLVFVGAIENDEIFGDYTADELGQEGIFYAVSADQLAEIPATPEPVPTSPAEPAQTAQPTPSPQAIPNPTATPTPTRTPTVVSTPTPQALPTIPPLASVTIAAPLTFPATTDGLVNLQNVFGLSSVPGDPLAASVDWGDGTGSKLANVLQFSGEVLANHQYEQNGVFYITVEVRSDTGSRSSRVMTIIVNISGASVTPTVTPVPVPTATAIPPIATATQTPISSAGSTFSLGSSKATVLAAQGNPSIIGGYTSNCGCYKWEYGNNWIGFSSSGSDGVVTNWEFGIPDGDLELVNYGPDGSSFTLGATTATVLTAQGNPSTIGGYNSNCGCYRWHYGSGYVGFDASGSGGLVKNWADIPSGSLNITNYGPDGSTFTLGSTTAAVLAAQGSPPEISGYTSSCGCYKWWFVSDHISGWVGFDASGSNGVVKNWDNSRGNLNLQQ
jgi:PGF-pre-PGF domain-containing protein